MHLYNVTLHKPTAITHSIVGNFSGVKQQEILVCKGGSILELFRVDSDSGKLQAVVEHNTFSTVRSLIPVRLTGSIKDYIVIGSDSGSIVIVEYEPEANSFKKVHQEPYGKAGCRRITPGQYLAADPKGRAVMIAAVEKQKFVYVLNRDSENNLTISSPLEAHKSHMITSSLVGLDVGFENPIFAALEYDYYESDKSDNDRPRKTMTFYEFELGLNHVVRKYADPVDEDANLLIPFPSGKEGPGGLLVCAGSKVTWKNQDERDVYISLPKRSDDEMMDRRDLITSFCLHKMKNFFFVLLQTENGDVFRLTCEYENSSVLELKLRYFDTLPPSVGINILKSGFLFLASEFGDDYLFQIDSLGDDEGEIEWSSNDIVDETKPVLFEYRKNKQLKNLTAVERVHNISPIIQTKVMDVYGDDTPQIFSLCGAGANSHLKIMRQGLEVSELVSYPLPGSPNGVWGLKARQEDDFQSFIVLSFVNATLVLSVGETVEEVSNSGFNLDSPTLNCHQMGKHSMIQIHPQGLRHISGTGKISEWPVPEGSTVSHSSCNNRQIVLALDSRELVYFELIEDGGESLSEFDERRKMSADITSLAIAPIPHGRQRSKFLTIGQSDKTIRIVSLGPESTLQSLGMQAVNAMPVSLLIAEFLDSEKNRDVPTYYLNVGLETGVFIRTVLDPVTGSLSDTRSRYLGPMPVRLFSVQSEGKQAVMAVSRKPWLWYVHQKRTNLQPMSFESIEFASAFVSEQVPEGILAIVGNTLRIITLDNIQSAFNIQSVPLKHTPRHMVYDDLFRKFLIIESDHRPANEIEVDNIEQDHQEEDEEEENLFQFNSATKKSLGKWNSVLRLLNPVTRETEQLIPMENNEIATAICKCVFHVSPDESYYVIATSKDMKLSPRSASASYLSVYRLNADGKLEFFHKTEIEGVCGAVAQFQGRIIAGIGRTLRIYDLGKRKLLRKTETSIFPSFISQLQVQGDRIYVADISNSVFICRYIYQENVIILFADDPYPRWITRFTVLDYNTICASDKFGNIFIKRLSKEDIEELEEDLSGQKIMHEKSFLNAAGKKFRQVCEYHVGDYVTSIERCTLVTGGREIILYTTLMGSIGLLIPMPSVEDVELFTALEMHMRQEMPSLCGRDHLAFRGAYFPVKCVVDGDMVEMFNSLPWDRRLVVAEELDRTPHEIARQIELIKARVS